MPNANNTHTTCDLRPATMATMEIYMGMFCLIDGSGLRDFPVTTLVSISNEAAMKTGKYCDAHLE